MAAITIAGHGNPPNIVANQITQQISVGVMKPTSAF